MSNETNFQVGDIVEILNISDWQISIYLGQNANVESFIGRRYKISFIGKMVELDGFPMCHNCSSPEPTPFHAFQLRNFTDK